MHLAILYDFAATGELAPGVNDALIPHAASASSALSSN
jgi:hypothetical protein